MSAPIQRRRVPYDEIGFSILVFLPFFCMVCVNWGHRPEHFRVSAIHTQLAVFQTALGAYQEDVGHFPTQPLGLQALVTRPSGEAMWRGPYLPQDIPLDPWGHAYEYTTPESPAARRNSVPTAKTDNPEESVSRLTSSTLLHPVRVTRGALDPA
ncbi:type II secretion system protein GspG [Paludibaculum fermentans]|uniref:Type II secretion system protein GspG n=1 Tax=Paludibaculum fermentans TaxID=1473598 RepID=A0A7S7NVP2_PALFE|nr:type II secretion system protein GspG [Paludibaculum fermentans]QOY90657.1 type II secretion system protein GspG [Paludibaculum fermentans]